MARTLHYPELYAELARQGKKKTDAAQALGITLSGLRYKQSCGDFTGNEMRLLAAYLNRPVVELFDMSDTG
jgi:hypothetical protein